MHFFKNPNVGETVGCPFMLTMSRKELKACWARNINGSDKSAVENRYLHSLGMNGSFHMAKPMAAESTRKVNMLVGSVSTNYIWTVTISLLRVFFPWWAFPNSSPPSPTHRSPPSPAGSVWLGRAHFFPLDCTQARLCWKIFSEII